MRLIKPASIFVFFLLRNTWFDLDLVCQAAKIENFQDFRNYQNFEDNLLKLLQGTLPLSETNAEYLPVKEIVYNKLIKNLDNLAIPKDGEPCTEEERLRLSNIQTKPKCGEDGVITVNATSSKIILPSVDENCKKNGQVQIWTTDRDGMKRLDFECVYARKENKPRQSTKHMYFGQDITLSFDLNKKSTKRQKIRGFGAALTDAVTINLKTIQKSGLDKKLMDLYFNGLSSAEYSLLRYPIASTDFSERIYTYLDEENDFDLKSFSLQPEDFDRIYWLKYINSVGVDHGGTDFMATSWTAPAWLKTNNKVTGYGTIKGKPGDKYHKTWAKYYSKFLNTYKNHQNININFKYLTTQNEPNHGFVWPGGWQTTGFSWEHLMGFIGEDLGPELEKEGYFNGDNPSGPLEIISHDDVRIFMNQPKKIFKNSKKASKYISGVGVHWYRNGMSSLSTLDRFRKFLDDSENQSNLSQKFLLATEACHEKAPLKKKSKTLQWERAEKYSKDIIENLNHYVTGWLDWNLCLDVNGGPNWAHNYVDSPILVNEEKQEFYVQPMFYHMAHFSKLLKRESVVLEHRVKYWSSSSSSTGRAASEDDKSVLISVAIRPDNGILITILNMTESSKTIFIEILSNNLTVSRKSLTSVLFYM